MKTEIQHHFQEIRQIIRQGQSAALQAVNTYLLFVNWQIGAYLSQSLPASTYGDKVVDHLAQWLQEQEPGIKGYDRRSLYRMKLFFETWMAVDWSLISGYTIQNAQVKLHIDNNEIVGSLTPHSPPIPSILTKLTWTHHTELMRGVSSNEELVFYLVLSIKERYTVRELRRQIQSGLFERQMLAKRNLIMPEDHPQKELLRDIFRDQYIFEFLDLKEPYSEFELKKALLHRMKAFLLELGRDFLFIDEEMNLKVGFHDYAIDLVFFHRELKCLVAFDLKIEAFKPEHLGKMNFYLEVLDREVRKSHENPSIGVLLCKTKDNEVVEIAMSRQLSPALVVEYQTKFVDKNLLRRMLHQWTEDWRQARIITDIDLPENTAS